MVAASNNLQFAILQTIYKNVPTISRPYTLVTLVNRLNLYFREKLIRTDCVTRIHIQQKSHVEKYFSTFSARVCVCAYFVSN